MTNIEEKRFIEECTVLFAGQECSAELMKYSSGGKKAIVLYNNETSEKVTVATENIDHPLPPKYVAIKDYAENAGVLKALMEAGVISKPVKYITSNRIKYPICKLHFEE